MIKRKGSDQVCHIQKKPYKEDEIAYITFPGLENTGCVKHLFSTRIGGVSQGIFSSMNLSYTRGDEKEAVDENYRRIAACLDSDVSCFVCSDQTHTDNIRVVGAEDMGKGTIYPKDYHDVDGLITNQRGIVLGTFFADCVPLFFVDPVKKAIGMTHSGWRGTVQKIGKKTVRMMQEQYGSDPADMYTAIGPSICQSCYEVSEDVIECVKDAFPESLWSCLFYPTIPGKYQLNLWEANRQIMLESGILAEHIEVTDICTCCNPEFLFSHRASQGKRGNLGAFLTLI